MRYEERASAQEAPRAGEAGVGVHGDGFTLIELMVVIAIIAIIAAIAIPNVLEARKRANERAVVGSLRTIATSQTIFKERDFENDGRHDYASDLMEMKGLVDEQMATGVRFGYLFEMVGATDETWGLRATCLSVGRAGDNGFWVDDTGVIRICNSNFADTSDPPIE